MQRAQALLGLHDPARGRCSLVALSGELGACRLESLETLVVERVIADQDGRGRDEQDDEPGEERQPRAPRRPADSARAREGKEPADPRRRQSGEPSAAARSRVPVPAALDVAVRDRQDETPAFRHALLPAVLARGRRPVNHGEASNARIVFGRPFGSREMSVRATRTVSPERRDPRRALPRIPSSSGVRSTRCAGPTGSVFSRRERNRVHEKARLSAISFASSMSVESDATSTRARDAAAFCRSSSRLEISALRLAIASRVRLRVDEIAEHGATRDERHADDEDREEAHRQVRRTRVDEGPAREIEAPRHQSPPASTPSAVRVAGSGADAAGVTRRSRNEAGRA